MKKAYEKNQGILVCSFLFVILVLILVFVSAGKNYRTYYTLNTVVTGEEMVELIVDDDLIEKLRKISFAYLNNEKKTVNVQSIEENILIREDRSYHHVILELELPEHYKQKDSVPIVVYGDRQSLFSLLIESIKED